MPPHPGSSWAPSERGLPVTTKQVFAFSTRTATWPRSLLLAQTTLIRLDKNEINSDPTRRSIRFGEAAEFRDCITLKTAELNTAGSKRG